jgi:hypothetical protein
VQRQPAAKEKVSDLVPMSIGEFVKELKPADHPVYDEATISPSFFLFRGLVQTKAKEVQIELRQSDELLFL